MTGSPVAKLGFVSLSSYSIWSWVLFENNKFIISILMIKLLLNYIIIIIIIIKYLIIVIYINLLLFSNLICVILLYGESLQIYLFYSYSYSYITRFFEEISDGKKQC